MASIEDMTDDEILAAKMPGNRGYLMPELRDLTLRPKSLNDENALIESIESDPLYKIGTPDIDMSVLDSVSDDEIMSANIARRELAESIGKRAEDREPSLMDDATEFAGRVGRGAKGVYKGLDALATDILQFPVKYARDPLGEGAKIEEAAVELAKGVASGDPESIRNAADIASMKDPSGVSDLASAGASARLAYVEPEKRSSHLVDVGISSLAAAIPLVGSGLVKQVLRGAPEAADVAKVVPETTDLAKATEVAPDPVFESILENVVSQKMPNKIGVNDVEKFLTGKGVRKAELEATNIQGFVDDAKASGRKSVSKDELIDHLNANKVQVEEVRLGGQGKPIDPERLELATVNLRNTHQEISKPFEKFADDLHALDNGGQASLFVAPGPRDMTFHQLRDNPLYLYKLIDPALSAHAKKLNGFANTILKVVGGPNTGRPPFDRLTLASKPKYNSYEEMTEDELRHMILSNDTNASLAVMEKDDLVEMARSYDDYDFEPGTSLLDWYNQTYKSYGPDTVIHPQDAAFFDDMFKDTYEFNEIGLNPNFATDAINPETIQGYRNRLGDMINRYSTGKGVNTPDGMRFLKSLKGFDFQLEMMQRPGGVLDQRALVKEFGESPEFRKLVDAKAEKTKAAATTGEKVRPTQWEDYTLPGGNNYQEILLTTPDHAGKASRLEYRQTELKKQLDEVYERQTPGEEFLPGDKKLTADLENQIANNEFEIDALKKRQGGQDSFHESHHNEYPNVLLHIRTTDRIDDQGRKILFVEEIQSDWHQKGRQRGYKKPYAKVPDEIRSAAKKVDDAQEKISDLPTLRIPSDYNIGVRLAGMVDDTVPRFSPLSSGGGDNTKDFMGYGLDWFESVKDKPAYKSMSDERKAKLAEFVELNHQRQARAPLVNELRQAKRSLVELSQGTAAPMQLGEGNLRYVRGDSYIQELESAIASVKRDGVPDAPFKKTEEWLGLAVKRIMREAAEKGYDGVAFTRGKDASDIVNMPAKAANEFYDVILPSVVKKESKGKVSKTTIGIPRNPDYYEPGDNVRLNDFNFIEVTPKVKERAMKPQKLFEAVIGAGAGAAGVRAMKGEEVSDEET
jgi:hypothetical protein